jgi:hypothetical protein
MSGPRDHPTEQVLFDLTEDDETTHGMNRRAAASLAPILAGVPEQVVTPARARELLERRAKMQESAPWTDHMTLEEFAAIRRFWSAQPANTTFVDALEKLARSDAESDDAETKLNRHVVVPNLADDDSDEEDGYQSTGAASQLSPLAASRGSVLPPVVPPPQRRPSGEGASAVAAAVVEVRRLRDALELIASAPEYLGAPSLRELARKALDD